MITDDKKYKKSTVKCKIFNRVVISEVFVSVLFIMIQKPLFYCKKFKIFAWFLSEFWSLI